MAITSVGYDGTVDEAQWASMVSKVGGYEYGIDGAGHFAVSQVAGTRIISVAPGLAWGRGVMDISDAAAVIQLDPVSTGSRWDLVALRRTWGPVNGGPSELVIIKGTSTKAIPAGRQKNPGVGDDQPLALVRIQAGSSSIPEIIDLRLWGRNGGRLFAKNDLVRSYIDSIGTEINIDGNLWQLTVGTNNAAQWVSQGPTGDTGYVRVTTGWKAGWGANGDYIRYRTKNGITQVWIRATRTGSAIKVPASGNFDNIPICTLPKPAQDSGGWWNVLTSGPSGTLASASLSGDLVTLDAMAGGITVEKGYAVSLSGIYFSG